MPKRIPFSSGASQSTKMHQHCPQTELQKERASRSYLQSDNESSEKFKHKVGLSRASILKGH